MKAQRKDKREHITVLSRECNGLLQNVNKFHEHVGWALRENVNRLKQLSLAGNHDFDFQLHWEQVQEL
jgi:hypothetical protein